MADELQTCLTILPKLKPAQLEQLRKKIQLLGKLNGAGSNGVRVNNDKPVSDDWLLDGIIEELRARGLVNGHVPWKRLSQTKAFKIYQAQREEVINLLEHSVPKMSPVERRALGIIVGRCYARYISTWTELSIEGVLRHINQVPRAVERSFPGYLQARMLHVLIDLRQAEELNPVEEI